MQIVVAVAGMAAAPAQTADKVKAAPARPVIVVAPDSPPQMQLAAREVRRYVYLRTGGLMALGSEVVAGQDAIRLVKDGTLGAQVYRMKTVRGEGKTRVLTLSGGSELAVLYAAYQFAESIGVRFYLHGDVLPDQRIPFVLPVLDETHTPLFETRGLLPFHDFTEGPDWWELDDYKSHFNQMVKMRMNFMSLHCYPEGGVGPEPLVWIGHPDDMDANGKVSSSYPSFWASTKGGAWGYAASATGQFAAGAGLLFEEDDFGASVTRGHRPKPATPEASNEVFNRAAGMLREAFGYGRSLGVKIGLGTETPLHIPEAVQARLREKGLDPSKEDVRQRVYEGLFTRIARAYPIDSYWLWTPESWTWSIPSQAAVDAAARDIETAAAALKKAGKPFEFGTCGWELGPKQDRGLFNKLLSKDATMGCINRNIGFNWVDQEFLRIQNRPKVAIPWLEDDSCMVLPQLWAGRVRRDAADALAYGCTGLMGIHWRTKILAPNVSALAKSAWSQKDWNPDVGKLAEIPNVPTTDVWVGGQAATANVPIGKTEEDPVYQTCRFGLSAYRLTIPNGTYDVTLKFSDPSYDAPGQRVFGVSVEGTTQAERLDIAALVGKNTAHDLIVKGVKVVDEELNIDFKTVTENPLICGIFIDGRTAEVLQFKSKPYSRRINCGGGKWDAYEADLASAGEMPAMPKRKRDLPCADFYADMSPAWFGPEVASDMADFLARFDGDNGAYDVIQGRATLPRPTTWLYGPGAIVAAREPWDAVSKAYAFVDELAALRSRVKGAGHLARFDYWLNTFRYMRALAEVACARGALDVSMERVKNEKDAARKKEIVGTEALPARIRLARTWETMMTFLLAATDTPGELGTIANLEQSTRSGLKLVEGYDKELADALGKPLGESAKVSTRYQGAARIIVPTVRTVAGEGESIKLRVLVLDNQAPAATGLYWRVLGQGTYQRIPLRRLARGVHEVALPAVPAAGLEYYLRVKTATGQELIWPSTAPAMSQTLVQVPGVKPQAPATK